MNISLIGDKGKGKKGKKEETKKKDKDDDNLFDLIDAMYESK